MSVARWTVFAGAHRRLSTSWVSVAVVVVTVAASGVPPALAGLTVDPAFVAFSATQGGSQPGGRSVSITSDGGGAVAWTASEAVGWLALGAGAGTTPSTLGLTANTTGLSPGVYSGEIDVSGETPGDLQVVTVVLIVHPVYLPASSPCRAGTAAEMMTTPEVPSPGFPERDIFHWVENLDDRFMGAGDILTMEFAIVPFDAGVTIVYMSEVGGRGGYSLKFENGTINGLFPYYANTWNSVRAEYRFGEQRYRVTVNGVTSGLIPFRYMDSQTFSFFTVHGLDSPRPAHGWFDSFAIRHTVGTQTTTLFSASFDSLPPHPPTINGTMEIHSPPSSVPDPCVLSPAPGA